MYQDALAAIDEWPVPLVAAGVVTGAGVCESRGAVEHEFALASVTKLLTAYAVLIAIEEGAVSLDAAAGPPGATVRHLLAHASGLAPDEPTPIARPGTRRIYSNAGFETLATTIEQASAMRFTDYLADAVLGPLDMSATTVIGSPAHAGHGPLTDLLRFAAELLRPRLVAPSTLAEAWQTQFPGLGGVLPGFGRQEPNDWGLGFERRDAKAPHWTGAHCSPDTVGHFGRSGTFLWLDPEADLALVVLTNREFGSWALPRWPLLSDAILDGTPGATAANGRTVRSASPPNR